VPRSIRLAGRRVGPASAGHTYASAGLWAVYVTINDGTDSAGAGSSIDVYDPARVLTGSGSFSSPAGACSLSSKCAGASTATFSGNDVYNSGTQNLRRGYIVFK
jgi:hypothetical protein